ncbi:ComEC/Rec2 family competence protein [Alkalibacterium kapii]|uniref:Metallo-beta-lactamase domain-containing protein n=1 Tax=Alkalibacterium kapii TaxID=426704 RepID=A0A511AV29_9LACT|nr:ComEC/Rec2 family competence protein [Alkalibacterium kapii]GEK92055.1 hypothetical protein AKA01nite_16770 [Alkalibacterium kapii]
MTKKKYRKKRTMKGKIYSVLLTTLFVGVAFLLGMWAERSNVSANWIESSASEIYKYIQSLELPFNKKDIDENIAEMHFFDMGQGASTLLQAKDGTTILIDTGRYDADKTKIINYLNDEIGIGGKIDLLIFTHNDADHIGNGDAVLDYFQVKEVWMNGMDHTTQTYSEVLDAMLETDVDYKEPKAGEKLDIGDVSIEVYNPSLEVKNATQNDASLVTRLSVGETALIQSGDISSQVEGRLIEEYNNKLQSDIMILGHHGSNTSTSEEWLETVAPEVAVYQAGVENHYGHPHIETIKKVTDRSVALYGTDRHGTIQINIRQNNQLEILTEEEN